MICTNFVASYINLNKLCTKHGQKSKKSNMGGGGKRSTTPPNATRFLKHGGMKSVKSNAPKLNSVCMITTS